MGPWYVRRAIAWSPVGAWLAVCAVSLALAGRSEDLAPLTVPVAVVAAAVATGLFFDEPALAITAQTPRGGRWARLRRLGAAVGVPALAWAAVALVSPDRRGDLADWAVVLAGGGAVAAGGALLASSHHVARPGPEVAAVALLAGLLPLVLGWMFDVGSPYPSPHLGSTWQLAWAALAVLGAGLGGLGLLRAGR